MPPALADAARLLVAYETGEAASSAEVAAGAARACQKLHHHLARVVGELGMRALFARSLVLASRTYAWLPVPAGAWVEAPWNDLTAQFEAQRSEVAIMATVLVIDTLVGLVARFIGDGLTLRLLGEVWPALPRAKETT